MILTVSELYINCCETEFRKKNTKNLETWSKTLKILDVLEKKRITEKCDLASALAARCECFFKISIAKWIIEIQLWNSDFKERRKKKLFSKYIGKAGYKSYTSFVDLYISVCDNRHYYELTKVPVRNRSSGFTNWRMDKKNIVFRNIKIVIYIFQS